MERVVSWTRENAAILALGVAVLTFVGGTFSGIAAGVWYLSTLATTDHVDTAVSEARRPLEETVDGLREAVNGLQATVEGLEGMKGTVDGLSGAVGDLRATVASLEGMRGTVDSLQASVGALGGTVQVLSGMVGTLGDTVGELDGSVDGLNVTFRLLASCLIELHGPWTTGGGDTRPYRRADRYGFGESVEMPAICARIRDFVNAPAVPAR